MSNTTIHAKHNIASPVYRSVYSNAFRNIFPSLCNKKPWCFNCFCL